MAAGRLPGWRDVVSVMACTYQLASVLGLMGSNAVAFHIPAYRSSNLALRQAFRSPDYGPSPTTTTHVHPWCRNSEDVTALRGGAQAHSADHGTIDPVESVERPRASHASAHRR